MQIQKDDIRKTILEVARKDFLDKGFKNVSMRTIAKNAEVGLSNIYNYFKNKDEILKEILNPIIAALYKIMDEHNLDENLHIDFTSKAYMKEHTTIFVNLITKNKEDLRILFFQSSGSALENFKEEYTQRHNKVSSEYFTLMKQKFPELNIEISEFFLHTMSSMWISTISELVMHDLTDAELEQFILEYMKFTSAGWKTIMNV